jgi:hypothetical protein
MIRATKTGLVFPTLLVLWAMLVPACGDDAGGSVDASSADGGSIDASIASDGAFGDATVSDDAGLDASAPRDAGQDAGVELDGGVDLDGGGGMDASTDASMDAGGADADDGSTMDAAVGSCVVSANARLTPDPTSSNASALVWDGTGYGIAWTGSESDVYFQRLSDTGVTVASPTRITDDPASSEGISLVWTGTEYAIGWYDLRDGNYEIYMARVDGTGGKIGNEIRVTNDAGRSWGADLVHNGDGYGVAWWENRGSEGDEVYFARLDSTGAKIGSDVRVTTFGELSGSPSLVWNGAGYGVAWSDRRDGNSEIYFVRLDPDGAKVGTDVRVTTASGSSGLPSLVWNGAGYGVGWEDTRNGSQEFFFVRLDAAGTRIGTDLAISDRLFTPWNLVFTGSGYAAAWSDARTSDSSNLEVYFAELDASGIALSPDLRVTDALGQSRAPSLAWTGTHYGVAWTDVRDGVWALYFSELCR